MARSVGKKAQGQRGVLAAELVAGAAIALTLIGCGILLGPSGNSPLESAAPTPPPDFLGQARFICEGDVETIRGLAARLETNVTGTNLVEQGTVVANLAGVITSDVQRLRAIQKAPPSATRVTVDEWLGALDATAAAQIRAVSASADRDVGAFRAAAGAAALHWRVAQSRAGTLRLDDCRPAPFPVPAG